MINKKLKIGLHYFLFAIFFLVIITGCKESQKNIEPFGEDIEQHIETLSSDEFEGRAPATPGGRKTVEYIETEFEDIGLSPAVNGSYRQAVPLLEITGRDFSDLTISSENQNIHSFSYANEMVIGTNRRKENISIEDSEIVFAGYGIVAPEYGWNDYEGIDVEGKTVVVLVNDPGFATKDEEMFTGEAMTYYGRWTYKFEEAARQGAAAALIIHQDEPAGYGWGVVRNSWSGTQYRIAGNNDSDFLKAEGWIQLDVAEKIFSESGTSLEIAMQKARQPDFTPEQLDLSASLSFNNDCEETESHNVIGYIEGSEYPDESVVYMAHWDHLGKVEKNDEVFIYNGAVDNATGVSGLIAMARRFAGRQEPPERSVVFIAVTAEESGLIGSQYYAENPLFPVEQTVAGINMDALNVYGPTNDVEVIGYGYSGLDDYLKRHAAEQGRSLKPNTEPEKGYYFRSDHFNMVKKGVPMIYASAGSDYIGKDKAYAEKVREDMSKRYHQPSDTIHDMWDYDGIHQDLWLYYNIGNELTNNDDFPNWRREGEFKNIRQQSTDKRRN
ncbi:MAG: M20/M25/M40 family metallo-hydrolase [Bacteroidales bacterium]|nr:M20/M25/M40 family metallo-hydrolase [Bacteroidales bacterium]MBS3776832.1 M20/M25/M40 family metallo-hydrolase [Bacteroidales bacterium]